jgi:hypothetical protein
MTSARRALTMLDATARRSVIHPYQPWFCSTRKSLATASARMAAGNLGPCVRRWLRLCLKLLWPLLQARTAAVSPTRASMLPAREGFVTQAIATGVR